jgi:hypothetical protein
MVGVITIISVYYITNITTITMMSIIAPLLNYNPPDSVLSFHPQSPRLGVTLYLILQLISLAPSSPRLSQRLTMAQDLSDNP